MTPNEGTLGSPGDLLRLIISGRARTRADLSLLTGMARSTVAQRVDALIGMGLLHEAGSGPSTGGRPPVVLAFNRRAGVALVADVGATHTRAAVTDLAGFPLAEVAEDFDVTLGPETVLGWLQDRFDWLLAQIGRADSDVRGIGMGVPAPVEFATGRPIHPPIMPGWDGFSIPDWFARRYDVPVLVDNDVNIMALGEHRQHWREYQDLLFVKIATGIGCGIVAGDRIHRGTQGTAGDIGHIRIAGYDDVACECGNTACLETAASGRAMARQLSAEGIEARNSRDVVRLARAGNGEAVRLVRQSGRLLGSVLAGVVNFFNPGVIVIGGDVAQAHEQLFAGLREIIYQRSTALATRDLKIERSILGDRAGVTGAALMVIERVLSPSAVNDAIAAGAEAGERSEHFLPADVADLSSESPPVG